jgi:tRNA A-37 threonylcarbamoyl transferase component Bud32
MPEPPTTPHLPAGDNDSAAALLAVVDAYLEDLRQRKAPDRAAVLAAHPELAPQLESCLAALDFIHRAERTDPAMPQCLGDFRIVREIGRGAMGVVYEAEQVSLKRRVALKVLRFGASPDEEAMARFRREAETVAALHHTNIVPLFAVGSEAGVHFFAMQLIAGRSVAAVFDEANAAGRALEAKVVVGWGVQAAEALAHAHARGVVHRDVKPSNLLLDGEGTVWLTDFGLARRRDEATLTVAGVLVGTPRYMSPEQAAARDPVDQRSDVYSLGASLYELATGKPVFEAATAGQLFEQIAKAEPVPPRRHRPQLPRDLETVLLRCLAKDPAQRYPTARDLADDLRRVASGDPIKARRPGLLVRLRRWAGRRRSQATLVAGTVAVAVVTTLVLVVAGLYGWNAHREARKGSVSLQVKGGPARGEIFDADGKPVVPPFTLPTQAQIALLGGWYRLRVTQPGRLSEEYELFIEQGQHRTFTVGNNDRQLWEPMPIKGTIVGDVGVLHIASEPGPPGAAGKQVPPPAAVIIKRLGIPARETKEWVKWWENPLVPAVLWELRLKRQDHATLARLGDDEWRRFCDALEAFRQVDAIVRPPPTRRELLQPAPDLDGDGVGDLVFVFGRFVLAISGKEGKMLWCRELHSNLFLTTTETETALAGPPLVVADIDGDGHPDLILAHGAFLFKDCGVARPCVEAVSGRTGKTLWRHEPPSLAERLVLFEDCQHKERILRGEYSHLSPPEPLRDFASLAERRTDKGRTLLAGLYDEIQCLHLLTGHTVAPSTSFQSQRYRGSSVTHVSAWSADGKIAFVQAFSPHDGVIHPGMGAIDTFGGKHLHHDGFGRPSILADLDGNGELEIITAHYVFEGATGKLRWNDGYGFESDFKAVLVGPDFDGDGYRDVFSTSVVDGERFGHPRGVQVLLAGLRSGKDGRPLWLTAEPIPGDGQSGLVFRETWRRQDFAGIVFYWRSAPGTAGHFVVNVTGGQDGTAAFLFAADTGRLAHVWPGVTVEGVADLDGDGFLDLYGHWGDQLVTVRGTSPEQWRRPGCWRWQWLKGSNGPDKADSAPTYLTGPVPHADLDGDGVADVLLVSPLDWGTKPVFQAYSGRDGRLLWVRSWLDSEGLFKPHWIECLDMEGKKRPVVVVWGEYNWQSNGSFCALLDGRTGKFRLANGWKVFPGQPRPDLLYRQPDGCLALVYQQGPADGVLVAVNADGNEVARVPFPARDGKEGWQLPKGFEFRALASVRLHKSFPPPVEWQRPADNPLWRFDSYPLQALKKTLVPVGWRVDPADSALLRFYDTGDNRLTVLRKGIPINPAREVPACSYPDEVVLKRPLPWLDLARGDAVAGVGSVAAYLSLVAVLVLVGRRKTALLLLALFVLLPAFAAAFGLLLVLALLVAALPWKLGPKNQEQSLDFTGTVWGKSMLGLLLLPGALLACVVLGRLDLCGPILGTVWTYAVVLVPLIVLAVVGWKKTALSLLAPCLLLLLYLNWPSDDNWRPQPAPEGYRYDNQRSYLFSFSLLEPPKEGEVRGSETAERHRKLATLLPYEAWDWSGWYWLWPIQLASWRRGDMLVCPLVWAIALAGAAEFLRRRARNANKRVP